MMGFRVKLMESGLDETTVPTYVSRSLSEWNGPGPKLVTSSSLFGKAFDVGT